MSFQKKASRCLHYIESYISKPMFCKANEIWPPVAQWSGAHYPALNWSKFLQVHPHVTPVRLTSPCRYNYDHCCLFFYSSSMVQRALTSRASILFDFPQGHQSSKSGLGLAGCLHPTLSILNGFFSQR